MTLIIYLAGASAIFLPFYHCVIVYFLLFIYLGSPIKSVTSSFWSSSQFQHPVLITAWAIDSSNILYENEVLSTTCSKSVAFPSHWFQLTGKKKHSYITRKLRFSCSIQADLWIPPLRSFGFVFFCSPHWASPFLPPPPPLVVCTEWKEGKTAAEIYQGKKAVRVVPCWTPEHQEPILLIYVMGRELRCKIVTILKCFYWGKEKAVKKGIFFKCISSNVWDLQNSSHIHSVFPKVYCLASATTGFSRPDYLLR